MDPVLRLVASDSMNYTGAGMSETLKRALTTADLLTWQLDDERRAGAEVLGIAQGGVSLVVGREHFMVPGGVWNRWVGAAARRAVETWRSGPGAPVVQNWIEATLEFMDTIPPAQADRSTVLMFAASRNTAQAIYSGNRDVAALETLVSSTWGWTFRRAFGDRHPVNAPHTLAAQAVAVHGVLAERAGREVSAAEVAERAALYTSLLTLWTTHLEEGV